MRLSRALEWVVARAAYPGMIVAAVFGADEALRRGASGGFIVSAAFVAMLFATAALERWLPFDEASRPTRREVVGDVKYLALAAVVQPVGKLGAQLLVTLVTLPFAASFGTPSWAKIALAIAAADLGKYALHRIAHERASWWRFHAEHHAPSRLHALNGVRFHPVNLLWNVAIELAPALLLGLDRRSIVLIAVFRGAVGVLQHANVDFRLGLLDWVFSTPTLHRWHHSAALGEANANYGSTFIV
ncbi:MAG: sterol desaturase family protein, partial [Polyangiales bacterium]